MYRSPPRLFVSDTELSSAEDTMQGDNLAMSLFALGTIPILHKLQSISEVKQVWLADDVTGYGGIESLHKLWNYIISEGQKYGYYANEKKSFLI